MCVVAKTLVAWTINPLKVVYTYEGPAKRAPECGTGEELSQLFECNCNSGKRTLECGMGEELSQLFECNRN